MKDDMTDIVPQLRDMSMRKNIAGLRHRAADEIERLLAENAKLHDALDRMVNPKRPDTNISVRVEGTRALTGRDSPT
jgi:hypothetical protein